jgi:TIGR03009 family protein
MGPCMRLRISPLLSLATLVPALCWGSPALGQTRPPAQTKAAQPKAPPQRTAQRTPPRTDAQPADANARQSNQASSSGAPAGARQQAAPQTNVAPGQRPAQPADGVAKNIAVVAPFKLTEAQQKLLDQILLKWEKQSDKVKTFKCTFTRWEYDAAFGNPKKSGEKSEGRGQIKYRAPDCGEYVIESLNEFDAATGVTRPKTEGLDHWTCDGKAIFEFNAEKKLLIERRLPPELQGKAISDGPLPFIFGAKAEQLKRRYWMRDTTPKEQIGKTIWLEAIPKYQQDAANFQSATVILNDADCMPQGLRIFLPGGKANTDYAFDSAKTNDLTAVFDFLAPNLSPAMRIKGWKHVVEDDGSGSQPTPPAAPKEPAQAARPAATPKRK